MTSLNGADSESAADPTSGGVKLRRLSSAQSRPVYPQYRTYLVTAGTAVVKSRHAAGVFARQCKRISCAYKLGTIDESCVFLRLDLPIVLRYSPDQFFDRGPRYF